MFRYLLFLLVAPFGWSQTVSQIIFSGITTSQNSNPVKNNGQTSHQVIVTTTGCTTVVGVNITIQGSADKINWVILANVPSNNTTAQGAVSGAFPFVRIGATVGTNCAATVAYLGSATTLSPIIMGTNPLTGANNFISSTALGGLFTEPVGAPDLVYITTNVAGTQVCDGASEYNLTGILVGVAGTTSTATIKVGGVTSAVLDTTKTGWYNINLRCLKGVSYTIDTAGAGAATLTAFRSFPQF
jgi:hypothetical protein